MAALAILCIDGHHCNCIDFIHTEYTKDGLLCQNSGREFDIPSFPVKNEYGHRIHFTIRKSVSRKVNTLITFLICFARILVNTHTSSRSGCFVPIPYHPSDKTRT